MGGEQVRSSRSTVAASKETLMSVLNTRMLSTLIARNLDRNYGRLGVSTNRMSSGLRINSAADDTANISVRELLRSNVAVLNQGIRNANDAVSLVQTADGAFAVIDEKLVRMKELAEQAATGTYTSMQRLMIDSEFQSIAAEINRIANATDFNGIKLLDGTLSGALVDMETGLATQVGDNAGGELKLHYGIGNNPSEDYFHLEIPAATTEGLGLNKEDGTPISIQTQDDAGNALDMISQAISTKDNIRAHLGAVQNRMEHTIDHNLRVSEEYLGAEVKLSDIDVSEEMTRFASNQIVTQIATSILAQANVLPQKTLELLR